MLNSAAPTVAGRAVISSTVPPSPWLISQSRAAWVGIGQTTTIQAAEENRSGAVAAATDRFTDGEAVCHAVAEGKRSSLEAWSLGADHGSAKR
jgi:hypothetical protein